MKNQRFTSSSCRDLGIRTFKFGKLVVWCIIKLFLLQVFKIQTNFIILKIVSSQNVPGTKVSGKKPGIKNSGKKSEFSKSFEKYHWK